MAKKERENERERDRERERKKRRKQRYGQTKLKHAKRGIASCLVAGGVSVSLIIMLAVAYVSEGSAAPIIGGIGLSALILAGVGFYLGIKGFKEREKNYLTCKFGVTCNLIIIILFVSIFARGLF